MKIFFHDTETTGIPVWGEPSDGDNQPHMVEIAGLLVDDETRETEDWMSAVIAPDGWTIPQETIDLHGITETQSTAEGIAEQDALERFLDLWRQCDQVAGHNVNFDKRIVRIATKRYSDEDTIDRWKETPHQCTGVMAKPIMQLPPYHKRWGWKMPKLAEAYEFFTGKKLENAHSAMADTQASMEVYFAIKDYQPEPEAA